MSFKAIYFFLLHNKLYLNLRKLTLCSQPPPPWGWAWGIQILKTLGSPGVGDLQFWIPRGPRGWGIEIFVGFEKP